MNKLLYTGVLLLTSATIYASPLPEREGRTLPSLYRLQPGTSGEILTDSSEVLNSTVEFDLIPQNSAAGVGVLLRYVDKENWIYVGCDKATDHLGFAYWYVETPAGKTEIARDISKLYAHYQRRIKVNCVGRTVTIYVDGEQIAHSWIPDLPLRAGKTGFRVKEKGDVQISNVLCKAISEPERQVAKKKSSYALSSSQMEVRLNKDFPSVNGYTWKKSGATLNAQPFEVKHLLLNGDYYLPRVSSRQEADRVVYTLKVKEIGVTVTVACEVEENVLQLAVAGIEEQSSFKVKTIAFPDHYLVSVPNTKQEACLSVANTVHSDSIYPLQKKAVDDTYRYGSILMLNTDKLVATLESNSQYNVRQFLYQTVPASGSLVTGIWGNEWIYRGHDGEVTELPYIKVILADDCNGDDKTDWQDGAVALQKVYPEPYGAAMLRNSYATITMNFASCAQYPFLRQLDNIKKFYLATDGFEQMLELKGYQSEGHDSGHPDYGGNYNKRAGGQQDLAFLAREAKKYNANIGVHINHSESYPEARAFNDRIITDMPAWSWLDQSYFINKEADMLAGSFGTRLNRLKAEVPDLSFVYLDTYREYRWLAYRTAKLFNGNGWAIWTEDSDVFDREAVWIHYNPEAKSLIHRFVHHQFRDGYATHPALMGGYSRSAEIGFMGWQKGRDFPGVIRNFFTKQLPYRYLMHYPVMRLDTVRAVLEGGLEAYGDAQNGSVIRRGDQVLMSGGRVFIPWDPVKEDKIYHYNKEGGKSSWMLPSSWKNRSEVCLYQLGSEGRKLLMRLPVRNGKVEIDALPDTGYVLYKEAIGDSPELDWSSGSPIKDTGFDSRSFRFWTAEGDTDAVSVGTTGYGQDYLSIQGRSEAGVSQEIKGLIPGTEYMASVWVDVTGEKEAVLQIQTGDALEYNTSLSESCVKNYTDNTDRFRTTWQRLKLPFRMPEGANSLTLSLTGGVAANDTSSVAFDDVRIVGCPHTTKTGYVFFEDFEHVDEGWGPFIACQPSAFTTHLSERHDVYTNNTIDGNWSLTTWRENNGEVYRTSPAMIRFAPEQEYEVSFDYKVDKSDVYKVVGKSLSSGEVFSYDLNRAGQCRLRFTTPACHDFYIVIEKQGDGLLVIDNFGLTLTVADEAQSDIYKSSSSCQSSNDERRYCAGAVDLQIASADSAQVNGHSCFHVDGHFVWGAAPIQEEDGKYYLVFTGFETETYPFSDAWVLGSKLGLAVSDKPDGGFTFLRFFLNSDGYASDTSSWDAQTVHNPHIRKFGDKYYLYYIGAVDPAGKVPVKSTSGELDRRSRIQQWLKIGVIVFDSFDQLLKGDFTHFDQPLLSPRTRVKPNNIVDPSPAGVKPLPDNIIVVNPSVVYRPEDQKYLLYFKGNIYDPTWRGVHGVAISDSPTGPFLPLDREVFTIETPEGEKLSAEDPYVWYNQNEKLFYAIFKDFTGKFTKGEPSLAIMHSKDGIDWVLPEQSQFMKKELILKTGEIIKVNRLERPQLLLDDKGNPKVLFAACAIINVNPRTDGGCFNIQIPIR